MYSVLVNMANGVVRLLLSSPLWLPQLRLLQLVPLLWLPPAHPECSNLVARVIDKCQQFCSMTARREAKEGHDAERISGVDDINDTSSCLILPLSQASCSIHRACQSCGTAARAFARNMTVICTTQANSCGEPVGRPSHPRITLKMPYASQTSRFRQCIPQYFPALQVSCCVAAFGSALGEVATTPGTDSDPAPADSVHASCMWQSMRPCTCGHTSTHSQNQIRDTHLSCTTTPVTWPARQGVKTAYMAGSVMRPSRAALCGPPTAVIALRSTRPLSLSVSVRTVRNFSSWCRCWPP